MAEQGLSYSQGVCDENRKWTYPRNFMFYISQQVEAVKEISRTWCHFGTHCTMTFTDLDIHWDVSSFWKQMYLFLWFLTTVFAHLKYLIFPTSVQHDLCIHPPICQSVDLGRWHWRHSSFHSSSCASTFIRTPFSTQNICCSSHA